MHAIEEGSPFVPFFGSFCVHLFTVDSMHEWSILHALSTDSVRHMAYGIPINMYRTLLTYLHLSIYLPTYSDSFLARLKQTTAHIQMHGTFPCEHVANEREKKKAENEKEKYANRLRRTSTRSTAINCCQNFLFDVSRR